MKLSNLSPKTQKIEILFPTGEATGITFTLQSPKTKIVREKQLKSAPIELAMAREMEKLTKGEDTDRATAVERLTATAAEMINAQAEYLATAVINWSGVTDDEGNDLPFSREEVLKLFQDPANDYIYLQVNEALKDQSAFFR